MGYALGNLSRNLLAGLRLALFMRVDRLRFRFDVAQILLLFAVSAIIDFVGDYLRAVPPREFAIEGAGSELYSAALLLLAAALIAVFCKQRQLLLSIPLLVLASLPIVQIVHYAPSWLALGPEMADAMLTFEKAIVIWIVFVLVRCVAIAFSPPPSFVWLRAILGGLLLAMPIWFGDLLYPNHPWWRGATDVQRPTETEFNAARRPCWPRSRTSSTTRSTRSRTSARRDRSVLRRLRAARPRGRVPSRCRGGAARDGHALGNGRTVDRAREQSQDAHHRAVRHRDEPARDAERDRRRHRSRKTTS
jgi:hypothetical protein